MRSESAMLETIATMMIQCATGLNRLPAPMAGTNAMIGHKTGMATATARDASSASTTPSYVFLPDGRNGYSIAVFIADSAYDMAATEQLIAEISTIVFNILNRRDSL